MAFGKIPVEFEFDYVVSSPNTSEFFQYTPPAGWMIIDWGYEFTVYNNHIVYSARVIDDPSGTNKFYSGVTTSQGPRSVVWGFTLMKVAE
jgi:hypothetical protein